MRSLSAGTQVPASSKRRGFDPSNLIDIRHLDELHLIDQHSNTKGIYFGGGVTFAEAMKVLKECLAQQQQEEEEESAKTNHLPVILEHMGHVACSHVRSAGSLAGNLMMVRQWGFHSDLATVLMAAGASVEFLVPLKGRTETVSVGDFVSGGNAGEAIMILRISFHGAGPMR